MPHYKIYKNSISKKSSNNLFKLTLQLIQSFEKDFGKNMYFSGWDDINFNKHLIKLRKNKKKIFSSLYNSLSKSHALRKMPFENKLHKIASKFLDIDESNLTIRGITFRMDAPKDNRNSYGWHQDNAYDKYHLNSRNGTILWIPLVDTSKKNGTLVIKHGSENSTFNCSKIFKKGSKYSSEQILVDKKHLKKFKNKHISVKQRDVLATAIGIFHKSGINKSKKFRFSIIVRYGNLFAEDFIFRRNLN